MIVEAISCKTGCLLWCMPHIVLNNTYMSYTFQDTLLKGKFEVCILAFKQSRHLFEGGFYSRKYGIHLPCVNFGVASKGSVYP